MLRPNQVVAIACPTTEALAVGHITVECSSSVLSEIKGNVYSVVLTLDEVHHCCLRWVIAPQPMTSYNVGTPGLHICSASGGAS